MPASLGSATRLRAPAHTVCRRAIAWWTLRSALWTAGLVVAQVIAIIVGPSEAVGILVVTAVITAVTGLVHLAVVPRWRFRLHRWENTDEAVHTLAGWLRLQWRVAPISRIQTIDTEQGPLQRLFRLSTVTVTTASASGALRLDGLDADEAAALAESLTRATEAAGGDAT